MKLAYKNSKTSGECRMIVEELEFDRQFYGKDRKDKLLTIAWNKGGTQQVTIDGVEYEFPHNTILCLMVNQTFHFADASGIVAWQFNRAFYCIIDHDKEVSCVGFLFYGSQQLMFTTLNKTNSHKIDLLLQVFIEEFETVDNIQEDMLRMLLKRLIIIVTRLAKQQFLPLQDLPEQKLDIIRQFNLLVENHYKKEHSVKFYANQVNRSPKTLSNLFALYNEKSPLTVIQERIVLEAKRLLLFTDKSAKEIAFELGFEDAAYFSNFFKKNTETSPSDFRTKGLYS
ncbi:AraC family transcriptional regulator [Niastella koreensis]|uniref:Transcriptional regulator, AraC family n=2 Tax=Niastella koreensis TaxID=354356 RepID=G8TMZ6_NIAKG|nr:helix-turn-helix domain-containing protein [Niastella koreensis]AEV96658.1 transcriptional regulator, AraC family [Niastella koreensis GR20-10]OQP54164.1 AraC family transcriptional regulator [Niastella koreensis]